MSRANRTGKRSGERSLPPASGGPLAWIAAAVLAISIGAVYGQALDAPLIFDDDSTIVKNTSIVSLWPLVGTAEQPGPFRPPPDLPTAGRPLVNLTFAINYHFGGLNPVGYHLFNLVIHFLSAMLLYAIVRRTLRLPCFNGRFNPAAGWLALAVAMLWALHPLQTEAVIYATQRTELMMAFFYLATLYCSLRYWSVLPLPPGEGRGEGESEKNKTTSPGRLPISDDSNRSRRATWLFLAIAAGLCGMASKEVMVSAPLIVLLFERTFIAGSLGNALRRSWPLYAGLAATWILLLSLNLNAPRSSSAGFHLGLSLQSWWLTQCQVLLMYLKLVIWPAPLLLHYELPYLETLSAAWLYVIPVLLTALAAFVLLWRNSPLGFLLIWIAAILAPTSVVPIPTEMAAERRMYLPLAALIVLFVFGGYSIIQTRLKRKARGQQVAVAFGLNRVISIAPGVLLVLLLAVVSATRLMDYHNEMYLWQQVAQYQPHNYLAHYNLGMLLNHAGLESESFAELQAAVAANPNDPNSRSAFGFALTNAGRLPEAVESLEAALAIDPDHVAALNNLGRTLRELGRYPEAIDHLQHALRLNPNHAEAHHNLGKVLANDGQRAKAIDELQTALRLAPDDPEVLNSLGTTLAFENRLPEAIDYFERALRQRPDYGAAHNSLGIALYRSGDIPRAIGHFRRFLELNPMNAGAYSNLGNVVAGQGDFKQAVTLYERAVQLQPDFAEAHFSLGMALAQAGRSPEAIEHFQTALRLKPDLVVVYSNLAQALALAQRSEEALRTAQQGIEVARSAGDSTLADQLAEWLKNYRAELPASDKAAAQPQSSPTK